MSAERRGDTRGGRARGAGRRHEGGTSERSGEERRGAERRGVERRGEERRGVTLHSHHSVYIYIYISFFLVGNDRMIKTIFLCQTSSSSLFFHHHTTPRSRCVSLRYPIQRYIPFIQLKDDCASVWSIAACVFFSCEDTSSMAAFSCEILEVRFSRVAGSSSSSPKEGILRRSSSPRRAREIWGAKRTPRAPKTRPPRKKPVEKPGPRSA